MVKIYACLAGNWVCLNDDPDCTISDWHKTPYLWWKEGAPVYAPGSSSERPLDTMYVTMFIFTTKVMTGESIPFISKS